MNSNPIFIGGLMKSGTSLLRKLLSNHPNIFGGLETHWFVPEILESWKDSNLKRQIWLRKFYDVSEEEYERIKSESNSGIDFFNRFMWFCTDRSGKKRWVEKTPDNILHIELIKGYWPDAKIIHVVRDYRDIYASWKINRSETLKEFIDHVHLIMNSIKGLTNKRTDTYFEVDYNRLVTTIHGTMRGVLDYLGEPWIDSIADYHGDDWEHHKVFEVTGKKSATTKSLSKPIFTSSIGQWQKILSTEELKIIKQELGQYMSLWGWE